METDMRTGKLSLSCQPEVLPRTHAVTFVGNQAIPSAELATVLNHVVADQEYTDARFVQALELNLRPLYEQRGMYRVQFNPGKAQWTDEGVSVSVGIVEGQTYQLSKVELIGDNLPTDAMLSAAKLPVGKLANWKEIQQGIWDMERTVKRTGHFEAAASPDRAFDDSARLLNLRIRVSKGPLYHFGEVHFTGLSPDLQDRARRVWLPKPGAPYDYVYPTEFFQAFSRVVDFRNFRKYTATVQKGTGDHVMDINLVFESR
jgi:outer membrane protein assembly factor BamA